MTHRVTCSDATVASSCTEAHCTLHGAVLSVGGMITHVTRRTSVTCAAGWGALHA